MKDAKRHNESLPDDLADALREESDAERAALERAWALTGQSLAHEPSSEKFALIGTEIWTDLEKEIRNAPRPARIHQLHRAWRWTAVAASFLVLVVSGVLYLTWEQTYYAEPGQRLALTLPDGSKVELNSGASLTYAPRTFGWFSRTTELEGEAFFEVVPRKSEFIARTHNAEVRVLGTSFNVRAWPEEGSGATVVALHTGKVRLTSLDAQNAVILRPGQMSRVDPQNVVPTQPKATDLSQATAWRTGRFVFVDEPLRAILDEMERRFDVSIHADAEEILEDRLTLAYDSPTSAESILEDIASSYSRYRYRRISGGYELYVPR